MSSKQNVYLIFFFQFYLIQDWEVCKYAFWLGANCSRKNLYEASVVSAYILLRIFSGALDNTYDIIVMWWKQLCLADFLYTNDF